MPSKLMLSALCLGALPFAQATEFEDFGRVVRVQPQVEQVNVPRQECRTEYVQVQQPAQRSAGGSIVGGIAGAAGAAYGLLFGYMGSTFASVQYSIEVLLFTLLGGAGTLLGPLLGVGLMMTLIDRLSELTSAYLLVIGVVLIALVLWFPKGILGSIRE
eukprot:gene37877-42902_t